MDVTWTLHGERLAAGRYMDVTWRLHGRYMDVTWRAPGSRALHGRYMEVTWPLHGRYMASAWQPGARRASASRLAPLTWAHARMSSLSRLGQCSASAFRREGIGVKRSARRDRREEIREEGSA